jgi:hypothetical protein
MGARIIGMPNPTVSHQPFDPIKAKVKSRFTTSATTRKCSRQLLIIVHCAVRDGET